MKPRRDSRASRTTTALRHKPVGNRPLGRSCPRRSAHERERLRRFVRINTVAPMPIATNRNNGTPSSGCALLAVTTPTPGSSTIAVPIPTAAMFTIKCSAPGECRGVEASARGKWHVTTKRENNEGRERNVQAVTSAAESNPIDQRICPDCRLDERTDPERSHATRNTCPAQRIGGVARAPRLRDPATISSPAAIMKGPAAELTRRQHTRQVAIVLPSGELMTAHRSARLRAPGSHGAQPGFGSRTLRARRTNRRRP